MTDIAPLEAGRAVLDAVKRKLDNVVADLARLQKAETVGKSLNGLPSSTPSNAAVADGNPDKSKPKMTKTVFRILSKGETFIDLKHSADPKKRDKDIGFEGKVPSDRAEKSVSASGSGSEISKTKAPKSKAAEKTNDAAALGKAGPDMGAKPPTATKPATPPMAAPKGAAAGTTPAAPKAPGATMKKEVGVFARLAKKVK